MCSESEYRHGINIQLLYIPFLLYARRHSPVSLVESSIQRAYLGSPIDLGLFHRTVIDRLYGANVLYAFLLLLQISIST
jgi:hypothetical protein